MQKQKNKGNKSVASPFGLRSGLRQSARPLSGWPDAGLKAPIYLETSAKASATATARANAGVLRCAQNDKRFFHGFAKVRVKGTLPIGPSVRMESYNLKRGAVWLNEV